MFSSINFSLGDISGNQHLNQETWVHQQSRPPSRALKEGKIDQIDENKHGMNTMAHTQKPNHSDLKRI